VVKYNTTKKLQVVIWRLIQLFLRFGCSLLTKCHLLKQNKTRENELQLSDKPATFSEAARKTSQDCSLSSLALADTSTTSGFY